MSIPTKIILFSICVLLMFTHLGCKQSVKKKKSIVESHVLIIDQDFSSEDLNDKVLVSTKFQETDLKRKNLKDYILKNTTVTNHKKSVISLGNYHEQPEAWFYIQIVNASNTSRSLVIEETNYWRCDALGVFTFNGKGVKKWGRVVRAMPLSERKIPFSVFAIPLTVNAEDTLNLLIQTQRFHAFHEVSLSISSYDVSLNRILNTLTYGLIIFILIVVCVLILLILGWIFTDKKCCC